MGGIIAIFLLLSLAILVGSILGWIAFARMSRLQRGFDALTVRLDDLERSRHRAEAAAARMAATPPTRAAVTPAAPAMPPAAAASAARTEPPRAAPDLQAPVPERPPRPRVSSPSFGERLFDNARRNWMAWLGGISVALAGIFLVGYSIEMGYLGPTARISLAVIAGLVLHAAAEYFRRRTGTAHPAFAAMAGGASITLYAALLGGALTLLLLFWRNWPLPAMLTSQGWLTRLHSPKEGVPYGIALAAAGLLLYPETPFMAALGT